jgi:pimeloyl-ACP methyl ester carboxylesterase
MSRNSPGPTSHIYFSQRLRLHYVDWGNEGAPPLILLHGGRDHCRNWDWVAEELRSDWHIIAPDLRGHGDSERAADGHYDMAAYVYDFAQLINQIKIGPVVIVSHSLGGNIALRYSGLYPNSVRGVVAIEGLGLSPKMLEERKSHPFADRMRSWIDEKRAVSGRLPRRYLSIDEAVTRMQEANGHLSPEQAKHLTIHGVNQNEDGTYSWKFDNYARVFPPYDMPTRAIHSLWSNIKCPTLLVHGEESWASDPRTDGRAEHFEDLEVAGFEQAGHWVHHDQLDKFVVSVKDFFARRIISGNQQ